MPRLELDHVFVCADDPAAAERALSEFGLQFARRRVHQGQGTSNACSLFENAYLELLYRHRDDELRSAAVSGLGLWDRLRWRETGACPFGVALREVGSSGSVPLPDSWMYRAAYLPPGVAMPIMTPAGSLREPMVFIMPREMRPPSGSAQAGPDEELLQRGKRKRLGGVVIEVPTDAELSPGVRAVCETGLMTVQRGAEHFMRLSLQEVEGGSGRAEGTEGDFRPVLPLGIEG